MGLVFGTGSFRVSPGNKTIDGPDPRGDLGRGASRKVCRDELVELVVPPVVVVDLIDRSHLDPLSEIRFRGVVEHPGFDPPPARLDMIFVDLDEIPVKGDVDTSLV